MQAPRLKFLEIGKSRHGKSVVYFRRDKSFRVRLPDINAREFRRHYDAALAGRPIPHVRDMPVTIANARRQRTEVVLKAGIKGASSRSRRRGLKFNLTIEWLLAKAEEQEFRCALKGIEFFAVHASAGKKNPYVPSLDRIDAQKGYTTDNVRIVILAVNLMLLDWGAEIFEQVSNSYRYWKQNEMRKSMPLPLGKSART